MMKKPLVEKLKKAYKRNRKLAKRKGSIVLDIILSDRNKNSRKDRMAALEFVRNQPEYWEVSRDVLGFTQKLRVYFER